MTANPEDICFDLERLRYARLAGKHSVTRTAEALGISRNAYYKKERGDTNITIAEFCLLMNLFNIRGTDVLNFFTYIQPETKNNDKG